MSIPSLTIARSDSGAHGARVKVTVQLPEGKVMVWISAEQFGLAVTGRSEVPIEEGEFKPDLSWTLSRESRLLQLEESASMACETPPPDCGCPGCSNAATKNARADVP